MNTHNANISSPVFLRFSQAVDAYLKDIDITFKSKATAGQYSFVLNIFGEWLKNQNAILSESSEITPIMITTWKQDIAVNKIKSNTIAHYLRILHSFFNWAVERKLYSENPVIKSAFPKLEEVEHDILSKDEIKKILEGHIPPHTPKKTAIRNLSIIFLLIESGVRVSELINLTLDDLDFENGKIYVDHGKGNKSRFVPFPERSQKAVLEYLEQRKQSVEKPLSVYDPLFTARNPRTGKWERFTRQGLTALVEKYVERATGHKKITAHDLRHAAASLWDDMGISMRTIQKALGHSNIGTTERIYVEILNKSKAAEEISDIMNSRAN